MADCLTDHDHAPAEGEVLAPSEDSPREPAVPNFVDSVFSLLARRYRLAGADPTELCNHNAKEAARLGQVQVAQVSQRHDCTVVERKDLPSTELHPPRPGW